MVVQKFAAFSECRTWRYGLWRVWDSERPYLMVVGLNPSTADETNDDPTVRRCIDFAKRWNFGGLCMTNLFAYRATKPKDMKAYPEPVGPENDEHLARLSAGAGMVLVAWGTHGAHMGRNAEVLKLLPADKVRCLKKTDEGHPWHPLYVAGDTVPIPYSLP